MVSILNGEGTRKVGKKPSLEHYDNVRPLANVATITASVPGAFDQSYVADGERTWHRDRALLVALGVNGEVPFYQAMSNAGLVYSQPWHFAHDNDNHEQAAIAA